MKTWFILTETVLFCPMGPSRKCWLFCILHTPGVNRTYEMAKCLYFGPGMLNDVKQLVESCNTC